jgi:hypothetical protein
MLAKPAPYDALVAALIGDIIVAHARLDSELSATIVRLQMAARKRFIMANIGSKQRLHLPPLDHDPGGQKKAAEWQKHALSSPAAKAKEKRIAQTVTRITQLSTIRNNLAHGFRYPGTSDTGRKVVVCMVWRKNTRFRSPTKTAELLEYTFEELVSAASAMRNVRDEVAELSLELW